MWGDLAALIGVVVLLAGLARRLIQSKLECHVIGYGHGARLLVTNTGKSTAYLKAVQVKSPPGARLTQYNRLASPPPDPAKPWIPGPGVAPPEVDRLPVELEVPPGQRVSYDFRFVSRSSASNARIDLFVSESSFIAKRKTITIPITPKAVTMSQNSDN